MNHQASPLRAAKVARAFFNTTMLASLASLSARRSLRAAILPALTILALAPAAYAADGTWTNATTGGDWGDSSNWQGGVIADGSTATASFNTLDITGTVAVNLDAPRSLSLLNFGDTNPASPGVWQLNGASTLTMSSGSISAAGVEAVISVPITTANALGASGALSFNNTVEITGNNILTLNSGTLRLLPSASLLARAFTIASAAGTELIVDGGYMAARTGALVDVNSRLTINSGTVIVPDPAQGIRSASSNTAPTLRVNGGVLEVANVNWRFSSNNFSDGIIFAGGTITIGNINLGSASNWSTMSVEGGDVLVTGTFTAGNQTAANRGGLIRVTAGRLTLTNENSGLILAKTSGTNYANIATLTMSGGITTIAKVIFGFDTTVTAATGTIALTGGTMFVGPGGLIKNGPDSMTTTISLDSGRLGADAAWGTALPITLPASNSIEIHAGDEFGAARDITLSGTLTGAGGFTKTGGGTLTLTGASNCTGATTVAEGTLRVTGHLANTASLTVAGPAALAGTGTIGSVATPSAVTFADGATLLTDADADTGALSGLEVTGAVTLGATLTVMPVVPENGFVGSGTHTLLHATGGITGAPVLTWACPGAEVTSAILNQTADTITVTIVSAGPGAPVITSPLTASGTTGMAFTYTIAATNNPVSFAATGLPAGLDIDPATGVISGTPGASGVFPVSITATNAASSDTQTLTLTIAPPPLPVITSLLAVNAAVGEPFSYHISAAYGPILGYGAAPLPASLSINPSTGLISGAVDAPGATTITISATNATGAGSASLVVSAHPLPQITSPLTATGTVGAAFNYTIIANNNPTGYGATGLPSGLAIDGATGLISGTPADSGASAVTISATNIVGTTTATLQLNISGNLSLPPSITSALNVTGTINVPFSYQIVATNSPDTYAAAPLPAGLAIDPATGLITGTPTALGATAVALSAVNAAGTGAATLNLSIVEPGPAAPQNGVWIRNTAGGNWGAPANWQGGAIADHGGLASFSTLDIAGVIAVNFDGPRTTGTMTFGDTNPATAGSWLLDGASTLTLSSAAVITVDSMAAGAYTALLMPVSAGDGLAKQGAGTLILAGDADIKGTLSVSAGTLSIPTGGNVTGLGRLLVPAGMSAVLDGGCLEVDSTTPSEIAGSAGVFLLNSGTAIFARGGLRTNNTDGAIIRQTGGVFIADSIDVQRSVGNAASFTAGFLFLGGTATVGNATLGSNNSWGALSVEGGDVLITGTFTVGNQVSGARGGTVRVTAGRFTVMEPTLGMILAKYRDNGTYQNGNNIGVFTGSGGISTIEKITFGFDEQVVGSGSVTLYAGALYIGSGGMVKQGHASMATGITLASGTLGADAAWSTALTVTLPAGNSPSIHAADEFGAPHDITFDGLLTGDGGFTKTGPGMVTLSATNAFRGALTVNAGFLHVTGFVAPTASGFVNVTASGGLGGSGVITRNINYTNGATVLATVLPNGALATSQIDGSVSLGTTLKVTPVVPFGRALVSGNYTILTASGGITGNPAITWACNGPPSSATLSVVGNSITAQVTVPPPVAPVITSPLAVSGTIYQPFSYAITADNWPTAYTLAGLLPDGITFNPLTGVISGITAVDGSCTIDISASNAAGADTKALIITIEDKLPTEPPTITSPGSANATVGAAFSYQIVATNPPIISYDAAPLPAGLAIDNTTGLITGTFTDAGANTLTISATNVAGAGRRTLTINAYEVPIITSPLHAEAMINEPFQYFITATNNPSTFSGSNLPAGFSINTTTGEIHGTGTAVWEGDITIGASNPGGSDSKQLHLLIDSIEPRITSTLAIAVPLGTPVNYQIVATRNPSSYDATPLPAGFTFDPATGHLAGTPPEGTTTVRLAATNPDGTGAATLKIVAYPPAPSGALVWTGAITITDTATNLPSTGTAAWDWTTQNWSKNGAPAAYTDTQDLYFDDSSTTQRIILATGSFTPANITFNVSARPLVIESTANATGTSSLEGQLGTMTIKGTGTVGIATVNNLGWKGRTRLEGGVYQISLNHAGQTGTPGNAGSIVFAGGTMSYVNNRARGTFASTFTVLAGVHALFDVRYAINFNPTLIGTSSTNPQTGVVTPSGTMEIRNFNNSSMNMVPNTADFTGALVLSGTGMAVLPSSNSWDWSNNLRNLTLVITDNVHMRPYTSSGGNTIPIGALAGDSPSASLYSGINGPASNPSATYRIGGLNLDTTYAGSIGDWANAATGTTTVRAAVVKEGTGMLTLTGTHCYIYGTTVSSGALHLTQTARLMGNATERSAVTVAPGAAFGGAGYIAPPVTFKENSTLLIDADPETGALSGPSAASRITFEGTALEVRPVLTGTTRISNGAYTILFSEQPFSGQPLLVWSHPSDPSINATFEYITDNQVTVTINGGAIPRPAITSASNADAVVGQPFTYAITAINDPSSPTTYDAIGLPPGLAIDPATGLITGTPAAPGAYDDASGTAIELRATNDSGTDIKYLNLYIYSTPPPAPVITSALEIYVVKSRLMSYQIAATNTPTRFSATGLPAGITINADGLISGIPETLGSYNLAITAGNNAGQDTKTLVLHVSLAPPLVTSPNTAIAVQDQPFTYQIEATNAPTAYAITTFHETIGDVTGNAATYLHVDPATGLITATCPNLATTGTLPMRLVGEVLAINATGTGASPLSITINPPPPAITDGGQYFGVVGVPFYHAINATNMYPAYLRTYGVTNIPNGLNIDGRTGIITGTPLAAGAFEAAFVASNVTSSGAKLVTFTINGASSLNSHAGTPGLSGNSDGPLSTALFNSPAAGITDPSGNLYIVDTGNNSIRKITPAGIVSTLATGLNNPAAIAINPAATTLYVADTGHNSILAIDTATGAATTLALTGAPPLSAPGGIATDTSGNLYIADTGNHLIRKIDTATGALTTIAGTGAPGSANGPATAASFDMPTALALSPDGKTLYIADTGNHTIRSIALPTATVSTIAGSPGLSGSADGTGSAARFNTPEGVTIDITGVLYVADTGNHTIRSIDPKTGAVITFAGSSGISGNIDGNAVNSLLNTPRGLVVDANGEIYVFDSGNEIIRILQVGPAIITPPDDQRVALGTTATFTVLASGGPRPAYQWYRDEILIPGATDATLVIANVQLPDVGYYRVVASNPLGSRFATAFLSISDATPNNPGDAGVTTGNKSGGGGGAPSLWFLVSLAALLALRRGSAPFRIPHSAFRISSLLLASKTLRRGSAPFRIPHSAFRISFLLLALPLLATTPTPRLDAQSTNTGSITGRVANAATGQYLSNALVAIPGTNIQTITDTTGAYRLDNIPAGTVRLTVTYAGLDDITKQVDVSTIATARADFDMTSQVYQLEKFTVAGTREGAARVVQEQRMSATQKAIFAADSFGNIVDSNLGELMKNLPGITIDYDGEDAATMRIRGMDPDYASITLDGNQVASIGDTDTESRAFNLKGAALQNIEKIEINAAPTADQPANTLGGQVNIITKSALSIKGRRLYLISNLSINTAEINFGKTPGGSRTPDQKIQPGFNFGWMETFGTKQRLGIALDFGYTRKYRYGNDYTLPDGYTYDINVLNNTNNTLTKDTPGYVRSVKWTERGGSSEDRVISLSLDYEPWGPNHSFYLKTSYNDGRGLGSYNRSIRVNARGSQAPGADLYNMLSPIGTDIEISNNVNVSDNSTHSLNLGARHQFGRLKLDYNANYSKAETNPKPDDNYTINYSTRGLGINIFNLAGNATGQIVQTSHDSQGTITADDPRSYQNIDNYNQLTLEQNFSYGTDERKGAKFNLTYPLVLRLPFTSHIIPIDIQAGASYGEQTRKTNKYWRQRKLTGSSLETSFNTPTEPALRQFLDPYFKNSWGFDVPIPAWISPYAIADYYKTTPSAFNTQEEHETRGHVQTYNELLARKSSTESNTAYYLQFTTRLLDNLTMIAGARYEQWIAKGSKPEFLGMTTSFDYLKNPITISDYNRYSTTLYESERNPDRQYNKYPDPNDPGGEIVEQNPYYQMYDIRQQTENLFNWKHYNVRFPGRWFPNLQFKWTPPVKNLQVRLARTENIGRPKLSQILDEQEYKQRDRIVTTGNPNLKPSSSVKYDLAIEYYPGKDGMLTLSLFTQDIKDYINENTEYFQITDDDTLVDNINTFYFDDLTRFPNLMSTGMWTSITYYNTGKGSNKGFEISYSQRLGVIHPILNDFRISGAFSYADPKTQVLRHTLSPPSIVNADTVKEYLASRMIWETIPIAGIQKRSANLRLYYNGRRLSGSIAAFWVDTYARSIRTTYLEITNNNAYLKFDLSLRYKLSSRWTADFSWRNMTNIGDDRKIFDRTGGYYTSGMIMNLGVQANF